MHTYTHIYPYTYIHTYIYTPTPQRSNIDAAMAVKNMVEEALNAGEVVILVSLDIRTAFDAAWWPDVIKSL